MDDTARLVSELHDKLTELDGKVAAYQRDMLAEFHKHMVECLKKYPDHVSDEVTRVIAESMSAGRYPALNPSMRDVPDSPAIDRNAWDGRKSPPPILRHTSGTPKETARSPHAREKEFQGVFTPNYLPLLEKNARAYSSPPTSPPPTPRQPLDPLSVDNVKKLGETQQPAPAANENRPGPSRRPTDRSTSSIDSSSSDSKALRRSALRRSSSSNKDSPRRVRFEFDGGEIFPTSSSPKAAAAAALALGSGAEPSQPEADTPAVATTAQEDESTAYVGTSLLDVEGEEDLLPRPKKVSSTQALQALTRSPLEEGTVWTVVNAEAEEPVKMNGTQSERAADVPPTKVDSQATIRAEEVEEEPGNGALGSPIEDMAVYNNDEDSEAASDEETLFMRPKKKTPSPTAKNPFTRPPPIHTTTTTTTNINGTTDIDEDHDPFFEFDDDGGRPASQSQKQPEKYHLPETEDDDDQQPTTSRRLRTLDREETAAAAAAAVAATGDTLASLAATKRPAVSPPSAALFGHSVGSYMGKTLAINPIKDPKLYEEIATMKDVHFFVGSIDGRSGVEAADLGSYRAASLAAAGGKNGNAAGAGAGFAPRSFTERLAMEEAMERRAAEEEEEDEEEEGGF